MKKKVALVTGITGQDGSYLVELLLEKNYIVHGIKRRSSSFNTGRIDHILTDSHDEKANLFLHHGDLTDSMNLIRIVQETQPDEIYNLGAMSHVRVSFESPEYTANADGIGTLRLLEAIRILKMENKVKIYQASTSELYGLVQAVPQKEDTPFYPRSPYAVAKMYAYWITVNYREAYGIYACNGILFNHESPRRGETFVSRKITMAISNMLYGNTKYLYLGNMDSKRDWGHAKDYVEVMWLMLQQDTPEDFVISTGVTTSVRDFVLKAFSFIGIKLSFKGVGVDEVGLVVEIDQYKMNNVAGKDMTGHFSVGQILLKIDPYYFRPTEVDLLLGDSTKAREKLGWTPRYDLEGLISDMMQSDLKLALSQNNIN